MQIKDVIIPQMRFFLLKIIISIIFLTEASYNIKNLFVKCNP